MRAVLREPTLVQVCEALTRARALELGLAGTATNLADGRVEVVAEGPREACEALLALLPGGPGRVEFVAERWGEARGETGFRER